MKKFIAIALAALVLGLIAWTLLPGDAGTLNETSAPVEEAPTSDNAASPRSTGTTAGSHMADDTPVSESASPEERIASSTQATRREGATQWSSRISGRVTDEHDQPIGEALIMLAMGGDAITDIKTTVQTDFDGNYEILNPHRFSKDPIVCEALLTFTARNHASQVREVIMDVDNADVRLDMHLTEVGLGMSGQVIWEDTKEPVPEAEMLFTRWTDDNNILLGRAVTDTRGVFEIDGLPEGRTYIAISPQGYDHHQSGGTHVLPTQDVSVIEIRRPDGVVRGQVVTSISQQPVPDVEVWLGDSIVGDDGWTTRADHEGRFEFTDIPREGWYLISPDVETERKRVGLSSQSEVDVLLLAAETIDLAGTVVESMTNSNPVPNFSFEFDFARGRVVTTNEDGRFLLEDVPFVFEGQRSDLPGEVSQMYTQVKILTEGWGTQHNQGIWVKQDALDDITVVVEKGSPLEVTALDPEGQPIVGASMSYGINAFQVTSDYWNLPRTDENGQVTLVRPLQWRPVNRALGLHPQWPVIVSDLVPDDQNEVVARGLPSRDLRVRAMHRGTPVERVNIEGNLHFLEEFPGWTQHFYNLMPHGLTDSEGWLEVNDVPWDGLILKGELVDPDDRNNYLLTGEMSISPEFVGDEIILEMQSPDEVRFSGRVVDVQDVPVAGVEFYTFDQVYNTRGTVSPLAVTDATGEFDFGVQAAGIENGGIQVSSETHRITAESKYTLQQARENGSEDIELVMGRRIDVSGDVRMPGGQPATESLVFLHTLWFQRYAHMMGNVPIQPVAPDWVGVTAPADYPKVLWDQVTQGGRRTTVDDNGEFHGTLADLPKMILVINPLPLMAMAIDFEEELIASSVTVYSRGDREAVFPSMTLEPWNELTVLIRDAEREPLHGHVQWEDTDLGMNLDVDWSSNTDERGLATLRPLPEGQWRFSFSAPGYQTRWIDITLPHPSTYEVTLDP